MLFQKLLLCLAPFKGFIDRADLPNYAQQLQQLAPFEGWDFERFDDAIDEAVRWGMLSPYFEGDDGRLLWIQPVFPYFLKTKLAEADANVRERVDDFMKKGNELDAKVNSGLVKIDNAIDDMRAASTAQATTGEAALLRFDTLVSQARATHDTNLKEIVDKIKEMESRGSGPAAGGGGPEADAAGASRQDLWFGQSLGAAHRDGSSRFGAQGGQPGGGPPR